MRMSAREQSVFARRLAMLLKANVPILNSLRMLKSQADSRAGRQIFEHLAAEIESGRSLAAGLGDFRRIFGEFALNMVLIGETSGRLDDTLVYLADEMNKRQALRRKIISAMVYPLFIVASTLGIAGMLAVYVFPKILPVLMSFKSDLPWTTKSLIFFSGIFLRHGWLVFFAFAAFVFSAMLLFRLPKVRLWRDRVILEIPVVGRMFKAYHLANFCRTLGLLLQSNVKIIEASAIAAKTVANRAYKARLGNLPAHLAKGEKISKFTGSCPRLFPVMLSQMLAVGETAGNLSDSLMFLGGMYEEETEGLAQNFSAAIEPALMIVMGVLVGFVAVSIISPIYALTQSLHP